MSLHRRDGFNEEWLAQRAPQKLKLLNFIRGEIAAGRAFPTQAAMARHMGWKSSSAALDACATLAFVYHALDASLTANGTYGSFRLAEEAR